MINKVNIFRKTTLLLLSLFITASIFVSCVDDGLFRDELPDSNSKVDTIFPSADFGYTADQTDFKIIHFSDFSSESNTYLWDFGGGATSTLRDPSHTFAGGEGDYDVTLVAGDANGNTDTITLTVSVVDELVAAFQCPDFLCSPRTPWGDGRGTSTFSGTGSPTPPAGNGGAKLSGSSHWIGQTILIVADADYEIKFWYVSKQSGSAAGALLIEDGDTGVDFHTENIPLSANASNYEEYSVRFSTGATTERMRFLIDYAGTECRYSKISIDRIQ